MRFLKPQKRFWVWRVACKQCLNASLLQLWRVHIAMGFALAFVNSDLKHDLCSKYEPFAKTKGRECYGGHPLARRGGNRRMHRWLSDHLVCDVSHGVTVRRVWGADSCVPAGNGSGAREGTDGVGDKARRALSQRQPRGEGKAIKNRRVDCIAVGRHLSGIYFTLQQSPLLEKSSSKDSWSGEVEMGMKAQADRPVLLHSSLF